MVAPKTSLHDAAFGNIDPVTKAVILIEERLRNIEERGNERSQVVTRIETAVNNQQDQINQVVIDMAVLKAQHASFWKIATFIFAALSMASGAIGWAVSHLTK